ncbi:response regulator receiver protein [Geobacter metallireducens RCH3]|uniref:Response regulator n=1 Tax=Geobacter metallireducens (strain ATCC 53774 / DSM 7210 / GS-15) TaxID=269799 RepID=Q39X27_GEOMG|nr:MULTISPECIES: response regulator [Geobacter]ABB31197.1 response regulator [Geobacter metallireducens GS-15]EHP84514.1 response regulator receiver protein [Geobacter metallireducens RCH3]MBT1076609.1 response regulator [Geobacter grbiciae]
MGNRILLADDSITIQKVVGIIFANEDCDLTVVDNGDSAVEKAREVTPDVMLVDALMPGKSGYEVCTAIRKDPALGTVPILLMTGAFEPFDEEKARQCGADDFISKPFESQQLIDKVKTLLDLGKSRAGAPSVAAAAPTMTAVTPPAAPTVAEAAESIASVAPVAAGPVESFAIEFDEPASSEPQPAVTPPPTPEPTAAKVTVPEPQPFVFAVEEASPADDLWGAFELEDEVVGDEPVKSSQAAADGASAAVDEVSPFGLEQTPDVFGAGTGPAAESVDFGFASASDEFGFAVAAETPAPSASVEPAPFSAPPMDESFVFGEESAESVVEPYGSISETPVSGAFDPGIEPFEMPLKTEFTPAAGVSSFAPEEKPVPSSASFTAAPAVEGGGGTITLTEEQLAAAISRISREVIERIAWEVVPDLAETLIKEEIRRIKEGS